MLVKIDNRIAAIVPTHLALATVAETAIVYCLPSVVNELNETARNKQNYRTGKDPMLFGVILAGDKTPQLYLHAIQSTSGLYTTHVDDINDLNVPELNDTVLQVYLRKYRSTTVIVHFLDTTKETKEFTINLSLTPKEVTPDVGN